MGKKNLNWPPNLGRLFTQMVIYDGAADLLLAASKGLISASKNATGDYRFVFSNRIGALSGAVVVSGQTGVARIFALSPTAFPDPYQWTVESRDDAGALADCDQMALFFFQIPDSFIP